MSQRDLVAELRAARVEAPAEVRERVRLIAAGAPAPARRLTWRRALVVALPAAAAVAAAVVLTRPAHHEPVAVQHGPAVEKAAPGVAPKAGALTVPSTTRRVQRYGARLGLQVPTPTGVSDAVKRATRIAASLGGYAAAVDARTSTMSATADLTLKVPRAHVQEALQRLSQLGTITNEQVNVTDEQAGLDATDRLIARLQKELAALRAAHADTARIAALTARIQALQRAEAATRRAARFATIRLHLATPAPATPVRGGHGPLHGIVVALRWLGIGALYALAVGLPVAVLVTAAWLALRLVRRRRVDALLRRS